MNEVFTRLKGGDAPILIISDHASAHVPDDIDLGIDPALLSTHIAVDIGVADIAALLVERLQCTAMLGGVSRLVIDLNREEDRANLVPTESDGHAIPGNVGADIQARLNRFHRPYHAALAQQIAQMSDGASGPFIFSLHSFTPQLATVPDEARPWEIGVLYNEDDRAARIAIPMLEDAGLIVGDQLPYSGKLLNATMNRHAEARGIPYLGVEVRQDIAGSPQGRERMADILAPVIRSCESRLNLHS